MKNGRADAGSANFELEESPEDRRSSCRYPVAQVPALLGWYEAPRSAEREPAAVLAKSSHDATALLPAHRSHPEGMSMYAAIMSRGPAFGRVGLLGGENGKVALAAREVVKHAPTARETVEQLQEAQASEEAMTLRSCNACILDISQSGMSLLSESPPIDGQAVWVRLQEPQSTDWVEGSLRGVSLKESGKYLVRLAFREACPYDFFKSALYGKPAT